MVDESWIPGNDTSPKLLNYTKVYNQCMAPEIAYTAPGRPCWLVAYFLDVYGQRKCDRNRASTDRALLGIRSRSSAVHLSLDVLLRIRS
jgi:hypothetical protein